MNLKQIAIVAVVMAVSVCSSGRVAKAQEFPGLGVGDLWAANMQFEQQFDQWARVGSWQVALATPNDQPLPFNAMTISNSINQGNQAFYGYLGGLQNSSAATSAAIGAYSTGAIQGNWYYQNPYSGQTVVAPYTNNPYSGYYQNNGYFYQGTQPGGVNYYQMQTWPGYYGR
jgi:hypothetical protein